MRHPYVFRCLGGRTFKAADRLLRFGVLPRNPCLYSYARKAGGVSVLEAKPLLPGYFCGLIDPAKLWQVCQAKFDDGSPILGSALSSDGHIRPMPLGIWT